MIIFLGFFLFCISFEWIFLFLCVFLIDDEMLEILFKWFDCVDWIIFLDFFVFDGVWLFEVNVGWGFFLFFDIVIEVYFDEI